MYEKTTSTNADGSTGAPAMPKASNMIGGVTIMTPSKWTVVIVALALAWLAFARASFSRLG